MNTTDGGKEWTVFDPGFPIPTLPLNGIAMPDLYHVYTCGWSAMIVATNDGVNWEVQDVPAEYAGTHLTAVSFTSPTTGYIVGWNGTILKTVNGGTLDAEEPGTVPDQFRITELYPNPVAAGTPVILRLSVPRGEEASLALFDALGRNVATIAQEYFAPGTVYEEIDTRRLARGTYLLRFQSRSGILTAPIIIR
jgi:hypothetical protein